MPDYDAKTMEGLAYKEGDAYKRSESPSKPQSQDTAAERMSRSKTIKSAASAYVRNAEADASSQFAVVGGKRSHTWKGKG